MRLKLDENLPESLVSRLQALGHDADTVRTEGLVGCSDREVWAAAQRDSRFFVTQDLDFSDLRKFKPGTHRGLLLVRLPDAGGLALSRKIYDLFHREKVEDWAECFVVLTEHKLRVQRPAKS